MILVPMEGLEIILALGQRMKGLDDTTDLMGMSLSKLRDLVMGRDAWHATVHVVAKSWTQLSEMNWLDILDNCMILICSDSMPPNISLSLILIRISHHLIDINF